jgi:hypothetical protein
MRTGLERVNSAETSVGQPTGARPASGSEPAIHGIDQLAMIAGASAVSTTAVRWICSP